MTSPPEGAREEGGNLDGITKLVNMAKIQSQAGGSPAHASDERNRKDRAVSGLGGRGSLPILHAAYGCHPWRLRAPNFRCHLRPALVFYPFPQLLLYGLDRCREPAGPVSVVVHLHEGDDPVCLLTHLAVAVLRHTHQLIPGSLDDGSSCCEAVVQAACIDNLHQVSDIGADRAASPQWHYA